MTWGKAAWTSVAVASAAMLVGCSQKEKLVPVSANDAKVNAAIAQARATLPIFWQKFDSQAPGVTNYEVKAKLVTPRGCCEHIWVDVQNHSGLAVRGTLANDPVELTGVKFGSEITFGPERISDWLYQKDGKVYGGYTVRALAERMSPEERQQAERRLSPTPLELGAR